MGLRISHESRISWLFFGKNIVIVLKVLGYWENKFGHKGLTWIQEKIFFKEKNLLCMIS